MPHQENVRTTYLYNAERFDAGEYAIREKPGELERFVLVMDHSRNASIMPYRQKNLYRFVTKHVKRFDCCAIFAG